MDRHSADRLALLVSHGQIEFDLLIYYFDIDKKYSTVSEGNSASTNVLCMERRLICIHLKIAFILTKMYYQVSDGENRCFIVVGSTIRWNGRKYVYESVERQIHRFQAMFFMLVLLKVAEGYEQGTKELSRLPFQHLTSELQTTLTGSDHVNSFA